MKFSRVHFSSATDNWSTPVDVFKDLDEEFNFTFDPCPLHSLIDSLNVKWGGVVFCNPPYSDIKDSSQRCNDAEKRGEISVNEKNGLPNAVRHWPTPTSRDHKDGSAESCKNVPTNGLLGREVHSTNGNRKGSLNPRWVECLMGLTQGWTNLGSWGMELSHSKPQEHGQY